VGASVGGYMLVEGTGESEVEGSGGLLTCCQNTCGIRRI